MQGRDVARYSDRLVGLTLLAWSIWQLNRPHDEALDEVLVAACGLMFVSVSVGIFLRKKWSFWVYILIYMPVLSEELLFLTGGLPAIGLVPLPAPQPRGPLIVFGLVWIYCIVRVALWKTLSAAPLPRPPETLP